MHTFPTPPLAVVVALLGFPAVMTAATAVRVPDPLDVSLQTLPVGFYGSYWGVRPANLVAKMSRMTLLILMQNDGTCWKKCCPLAETDPVSKCGPLHNASALPGCDPSCDQQLTQIQQFAAIKEAAKAAGRRAPHCMMYLNAVYLWPFDASNSQGRTVRTACPQANCSWPPPPHTLGCSRPTSAHPLLPVRLGRRRCSCWTCLAGHTWRRQTLGCSRPTSGAHRRSACGQLCKQLCKQLCGARSAPRHATHSTPATEQLSEWVVTWVGVVACARVQGFLASERRGGMGGGGGARAGEWVCRRDLRRLLLQVPVQVPRQPDGSDPQLPRSAQRQ
eukprot:COSAG01_NODE_220_length_21453_cov_118.998361_19_plen_333_part_00